MALLQTLISYLAPLFLILSPITSYLDQILSMSRTRSSAGFSLDIPLIMLSASIIKIFYYPGARFDLSLLIQAVVMLVVQSVLLKVALEGRRLGAVGAGFEMKISERNGSAGSGIGGMQTPTWAPRRTSSRPWDFWRWREQTPYWQTVFSLAGVLLGMHILLRPAPGRAEGYTSLLGAVGLSIEALLPLPQLWQNYSSQSCKGFRLSVIINWLFGDAMKMAFFFTSAPGAIPFAFKACGVFQAVCDVLLGLQFAIYGEGNGEDHDDGRHFA